MVRTVKKRVKLVMDQSCFNNTGAQQKSPTSALSIETIEGVEPLDNQFDVNEPKTVPDKLYNPLFDQPPPTETEIKDSDGNVPPMKTYAILDAAKIVNLPELLDASGLKHKCLFKGDAYDDFKDVAPWVVQLKDHNKFTQNLFTQGEAPWFFWDKGAGIYIRSRATLDDMWQHFRKFTKVQDENGKWYYFRFWETGTSSDIFKAYLEDGLVNIFNTIYKIIIINKNSVEILSLKQSIERKKIILSHQGSRKYLSYRENRLSKQITEHLLRMKDFSHIKPSYMKKYVEQCVAYSRSFGFTEGADIFIVTLSYCLSNETDTLDGRVKEIMNNQNEPLSVRRMEVIEYLNEINKA